MRIALVAPPFIPVPPRRYGGTELFIAHLAAGLTQLGHTVVVYANGESSLPCEVRSLYPTGQWPIDFGLDSTLKDLNHTSWACRDAAGQFDVVHLNNAPGLAFSRLLPEPVIYTVHHAKEQGLSDFYAWYPHVTFVTISEFQRTLETMHKIRSVHHGIDLSVYPLVERKQEYLSFLGRIAPMKGTHLAIEVAKRAGIPLKIAGEIQPMYRDYWERDVKPQIDGRFIEYVGEADHRTKVELLGHSRALLFPIQWNEPFGLVMIEAMACGTPVVALPGGSVTEVVADGASGWVCVDIEDMCRRVCSPLPDAASCRRYVEQRFSLDVMVKHYEQVYESVLLEGDDAVPLEERAPLHA